MIAVFTGTRREGAYPEVRTKIEDLHRQFERGLTVLVGDCPTGVDRDVRAACAYLGVNIAVFHAHWHIHGNGAGPRRNAAMISVAEDMMHAGNDVSVYYRASWDSKGTVDCVQRASQAALNCVCLGGPEL